MRFQLISDGAYDMLLFDDRYPRPPAAILPETSTRDLRTLPGAEYLLIYHDLFADDPLAQPWLLRLDSLRRASFNGSVDTIRLSTIYEQFSDGVVTPVAIHDFLKYAYDHWPVRPTHACLVGDGLMEIRSRTQTGNLISSVYPLTLDFGASAADGCSAASPDRRGTSCPTSPSAASPAAPQASCRPMSKSWCASRIRRSAPTTRSTTAWRCSSPTSATAASISTATIPNRRSASCPITSTSSASTSTA